MSKKRFLVISYNDDEQEDLRDFVAVEVADGNGGRRQAMEIAGRMRPYAVPVCAIELGEFEYIHRNLEKATDAQCSPFHDQVKDLTRERCVELLESIDIQCYDREDVGTLREAVRANLEDGTLNADEHDLYIQ